MNHFPMLLKWQYAGSDEIITRQIYHEEMLKSQLQFVRNRNPNWWLIRMADDVVLAQSKGYRP